MPTKEGEEKRGLEQHTKKRMRQPGVEPGSLAWEARMITATLLALRLPAGEMLRY